MQRTTFSGIGYHAAMVCTVLPVFCLCGLAGAAWAQHSIRFEAEDVTGPADAWQADRYSDDKWNLWSTDKDAAKKWSGGVVLQSPRVLQDREKPEDGAPPLHTRIASEKISPGKYYVEIGGVARPLAISRDGKNWKKIEGSARNLGLLEVGAEGFQLWVDDRYASGTNPGSAYYDYLEFTPLPDPNRKPKVQGFAETRITEPLGRGLVAMPIDGGRIYVGWRLLKDDPKNIAFDVYRRTAGAASQKLNQAPLSQTTDFVDESPVTGMRNEYVVVPVAGPEAGKPSAVAGAVPSERGQNYLSVKLNGDHTFQKCGIADLNGDGIYDYVIKQPSANIDPYEMYWQRSPETYKIEAYLGDGTFLWRYDMGWAIERGIWYSPVVVYDLDGDGRAEVCLKAGEGDPRDSDGRVQSGPEYLLVLDGMTGQEKARVDWPPREAFPSYNYASRNQLAVAFLDGKTPCLIVVRGTYNVIQVRAYQYRAGELGELWRGATRRRAVPIAVRARTACTPPTWTTMAETKFFWARRSWTTTESGSGPPAWGIPITITSATSIRTAPDWRCITASSHAGTRTVAAWSRPAREKFSGAWTDRPGTCIPPGCVPTSTAACRESRATRPIPTPRRSPTSAGCSTAAATSCATISTGDLACGPSGGTRICSENWSKAGGSSNMEAPRTWTQWRVQWSASPTSWAIGARN